MLRPTLALNASCLGSIDFRLFFNVSVCISMQGRCTTYSLEHVFLSYIDNIAFFRYSLSILLRSCDPAYPDNMGFRILLLSIPLQRSRATGLIDDVRDRFGQSS